MLNIISQSKSDDSFWFLFGLFILAYLVVSLIKTRFSKTSKASRLSIEKCDFPTQNIFGQESQDFKNYSNYTKLNFEWRLSLLLILTIISFTLIIEKKGQPVDEIKYSEHNSFFAQNQIDNYNPQLNPAEDF